tara:strand:+ start:408 stop:863 length:456 start_codon:yes stop_codon:yes gene_type:complete
MTELIKKIFPTKLWNYLVCGDCLKDLEKVLAFVTLVGVFIFSLVTIFQFALLDWTQLDSYRFMLERVLELAIGVELARLLLSYSLDTVIELLAFVIARKMVLLEDAFVELILGASALMVLFIAKAILGYTEAKERNLDEKTREMKVEFDNR